MLRAVVLKVKPLAMASWGLLEEHIFRPRLSPPESATQILEWPTGSCTLTHTGSYTHNHTCTQARAHSHTEVSVHTATLTHTGSCTHGYASSRTYRRTHLQMEEHSGRAAGNPPTKKEGPCIRNCHLMDLLGGSARCPKGLWMAEDTAILGAPCPSNRRTRRVYRTSLGSERPGDSLLPTSFRHSQQKMGKHVSAILGNLDQGRT